MTRTLTTIERIACTLVRNHMPFEEHLSEYADAVLADPAFATLLADFQCERFPAVDMAALDTAIFERRSQGAYMPDPEYPEDDTPATRENWYYGCALDKIVDRLLATIVLLRMDERNTERPLLAERTEQRLEQYVIAFADDLASARSDAHYAAMHGEKLSSCFPQLARLMEVAR